MTAVTDTILVPTDGSDPATAAARHARLLATELDAAVHVLSVVSEAGVGGRDNPRTAAEGAAADAASSVGGGDASAAPAAIEPTTTVREGDPAETILAHADEIDADLIVMGTHGRTGVGRILLGSTTERLIRHAAAPVLSVRADDTEERGGE